MGHNNRKTAGPRCVLPGCRKSGRTECLLEAAHAHRAVCGRWAPIRRYQTEPASIRVNEKRCWEPDAPTGATTNRFADRLLRRCLQRSIYLPPMQWTLNIPTAIKRERLLFPLF